MAAMNTVLHRRIIIGLLALFAGSIGFSLGGMTLLRYVPSAAAQAGALLPWLMKVPTWVYMVTLPALVLVLYLPRIGWRRSILALIWGSFVGMMAELIGTGTGLPFGEYAYTAFLNPKIMGDVPWFIPPSWYAVSMISLDLATRLGLTKAARLGAAALFMVLWDVGLDPAMGAGFPIWEWKVEGFFYSMPAINWIGWFVTSLVIVWGFEDLVGLRFREPTPWTARIWVVNGLLPVGICVITGLGTAALAGGLALLIPVMAAWGGSHTRPTPALG
jgi:putative membrane protein